MIASLRFRFFHNLLPSLFVLGTTSHALVGMEHTQSPMQKLLKTYESIALHSKRKPESLVEKSASVIGRSWSDEKLISTMPKLMGFLSDALISRIMRSIWYRFSEQDRADLWYKAAENLWALDQKTQATRLMGLFLFNSYSGSENELLLSAKKDENSSVAQELTAKILTWVNWKKSINKWFADIKSEYVSGMNPYLYLSDKMREEGEKVLEPLLTDDGRLILKDILFNMVGMPLIGSLAISFILNHLSAKKQDCSFLTNTCDYRGESFLIRVLATESNRNLLDLVLDKGACVNIYKHYGYSDCYTTPLISLLSLQGYSVVDNTEMLKKLLAWMRNNLDEKQRLKILNFSVKDESISLQSEIKYLEGKVGRTALGIASKNRSFEQANLLLQEGTWDAHAFAADACYYGNAALVKAFLDHKPKMYEQRVEEWKNLVCLGIVHVMRDYRLPNQVTHEYKEDVAARIELLVESIGGVSEIDEEFLPIYADEANKNNYLKKVILFLKERKLVTKN